MMDRAAHTPWLQVIILMAREYGCCLSAGLLCGHPGDTPSECPLVTQLVATSNTLWDTSFCLDFHLFQVSYCAFDACIHVTNSRSRPQSLHGLPLGVVRGVLEAGRGKRESSEYERRGARGNLRESRAILRSESGQSRHPGCIRTSLRSNSASEQFISEGSRRRLRVLKEWLPAFP